MKNRELPDKAIVAAQSALVLMDLFDLTEDVQCWVKDRAGVILWANKNLILQYSENESPEDVIGKTDYELSPKEIADHFRADDERVLAGAPVIKREEMVTGLDHLFYWYVTTKLPVYDATGAIIGTAGMTRKRVEAPAKSSDSPLPKLLAYIREHYMENPDNGLLALYGHMSEEELLSLFEHELHMTPQAYLRRVKVRLSIHDLVDAGKSFDEIAQKHGFRDQAHFVEEFSQETGETPRSYRLNLFRRGAVRI